ncbi:MAG: PAS domain-containing protein [Filimonas sp.]|nr:PAS domain-containing protein [Filimonas sp.]
MKLELFNDEANRIWKRAAVEDDSVSLLQPELEFYKKMLIFFQIGESYYLIFNYQTLEIDFVSREITNLLGYEPHEASTAFLMSCVHPDDRKWFLDVQNASIKFLMSLTAAQQLKYKLRFDCRFRKKSGEYVRCIQQAVVIKTDTDGNIYKTLIIYTDISHLKSFGRPILSYIGLEGEPSYLDVNVYESKGQLSNSVLSRREKEVLFLIMEGKASKEIAGILNISKSTVDNHRRNILNRNGIKSTGELIAKAIKDGWI